MTREEKIKKIGNYCAEHNCDNSGGYCDCELKRPSGFVLELPVGNCGVRPYALNNNKVSDGMLDKALEIIGVDDDEEPKKDMINPDHYKVHANECVDEIRAMLTPEEFKGFLKGNFLKYRYRSGHKDDPEQEAKKSDWYMNKLMEVEANA